MAFKLYSTDDGYIPAWEYHACEAITPKVGLCLAFDTTSEQLEVSETPTHICMREESAAVGAGTVIPVVRIQKDQVWETVLDGDTSFTKGSLVDVDSTGLKVDADSSSDDVFQLTYMAGDDAGDIVRGRFVK